MCSSFSELLQGTAETLPLHQLLGNCCAVTETVHLQQFVDDWCVQPTHLIRSAFHAFFLVIEMLDHLLLSPFLNSDVLGEPSGIILSASSAQALIQLLISLTELVWASM